MTYAEFERQNNMAKPYFPVLGKIGAVNFKKGTCSFHYLDNKNTDVNIQDIVADVMYNGMGALSNPEKLKNWPGFTKV